MLFLIPDGEGRIMQANKVYDPEGYDKRLDDGGVKYVKVDHHGVLSPDEWMIADGAPTERPPMTVVISSLCIKAGDNDAAVITGAPKDVTFAVSVGDSSVWSGTLPDGELELSVPTPGLYLVSFKKWPYRDFNVTIEAVA